MAFIQHSLEAVFHSFSKQTILVVGDLMLDQHIIGKTNRISPEAPVPVLEFERETSSLGGAANVAFNINALGARAVPIGVVGKDKEGDQLVEMFRQYNIPTDGIVAMKNRFTTVKTRFMAGGHHLLRLDKEVTNPLPPQTIKELVGKFMAILNKEKVTGIVFQDYNKGVLTDQIIAKVIEEAQRRGIPVTVDPKFHSFWLYQGADLFKPNLKEVSQIFGEVINPDLENLSKASATLREKLNARAVIITLSEKGVFFDDGQNHEIIPAQARALADPCGAGDTVISVATVALASGMTTRQVAQLANLAGGQVVEHSGVVAINKDLLFEEALHHKIFE